MKKRHYVYLIQEKIGLHAPVKIGVARDIEKRFEALQTGNSRKLVVIGKIGPFTRNHAMNTEKGLHDRFSQFRIRGEWFSGVILSKMEMIGESHVLELQ